MPRFVTRAGGQMLCIIGSMLLIPYCYKSLIGTYSIEYGEQPIHTLTRVLHRPWEASMLEVAESYILKLLRVAPNLRELSILPHLDLELPPERTPTAPSSFLVHEINKLTIDDIEGRLAPLLFPKVTLPSLKYLYYMGSVSPFVDLMLRSLPRLEYLEILSDLRSLSQDALGPTLRLLPTLETIYIFSAERMSWLFRELANGYGGRKTCPVLRTMVINSLFVVDDNDRDETSASLCAMLNSRPGHWTMARINREKFEIPSHSPGAPREFFSENLNTRCCNSIEFLGRQGH